MSVLRKILVVCVLCLLPLLFLNGCRTPETDDALGGRMLLWHTWTNGEAAALNDVLATFQEIHPAVVIKQQQFANLEDMLTQFQVAADAGLGPDLMIAPGPQVRSLADAGLIRAIDAALDEPTLQRYDPAALDSLRYAEGLFGLPAAMDTLVLYYDTTLVEAPAATLDALLAEAAQGRLVAMSTNFTDAFWGVQAFGGTLFDAERRVILDRGGFANWLAWLKAARDAPGMLLDSNREVLRNRFIDDGVAYYVGYASEYSLIVEGIAEPQDDAVALEGTADEQDDAGAGGKGAENVGVALLPAGPTGGAAPFLTVQAFLFSAVSSANQRTLALEVAKFVTNAEQQSTLMRETRLVPVNNGVRVNARLNPLVATFTAQARAAVPILNIPEMDAVFRYGGDAYTRVLEGVVEPAEAAIAVTAAINEANNIATVATTGQQCTSAGTLHIGYLLGERQEVALTAVLNRLQRDCPQVIVNAVPIALEPATVALTGDTTGTPSAGATSPLTHTLDALTLDALTLDASAADAVSARLATALAAEGRLDLLLVPHRWIPTLVANEELRELSTLIDAETLQRYRPVAVEAMRYQGGLYGLPLTVNLDVLYYNRTLVEEPARTLAELQQQAAAGTPIALDYTFRHAFWGIPAFGGQLIDAQGQLALGQGSFVNWLSWLQQARDTANLLLLPDRSVLLTRFLNRNSAYYVAGPAALPQLQAALGADTVGVARLPSGPDGDAGSLLTATGLLFSDRLSASQLELAFTVANYLTSIQSQRTFFAMADQIPTNIGFDVPPEAPLAAVAEQVQAGVLLVNLPVIDLLLRQGDSVYQAVLEEGVAPEVAVEELLRAVAEAPVE